MFRRHDTVEARAAAEAGVGAEDAIHVGSFVFHRAQPDLLPQFDEVLMQA